MSIATPPAEDLGDLHETVSQNAGLAPFFDNLESFVEFPEGLPKLRDFVLDLAVRGKLVDQESNEEPAIDLLECIREANGQNGKKRKKAKAIADDEHPFNLPSSWC